MPKYCLNYETGEYEWIDRNGYSWDSGEFTYNWDDSEYKREEEEERRREEEEERRHHSLFDDDED